MLSLRRLAMPFLIAVACTAFLIIAAACSRSNPSTSTPTPTPDRYATATCTTCHTDKAKLAASIKTDRASIVDRIYGAPAPDVSMVDRLYVSPDFANTTHGKIACQACHNGQSSPDASVAHQGLVRDPSAQRLDVCAACHKDIVTNFAKSLHSTTSGQIAAVSNRVLDGIIPPGLGSYVDKNCTQCHATCGQCHVSRPDAGKGGLLQAHNFVKTPPVKDTCVQCHGANTVGAEYYGSASSQGDVHWTKAKMDCTACHKEAELHGQGGTYAKAAEDREMPQCADCHKQADLAKRVEHLIHGSKLSCYVCHSSGPVNNCSDCHVNAAPTFRQTSALKIGLNSEQDSRHPYQFVVVSHVPVRADTFSSLGVNLADFNDVPTWKPTTPHNIQAATTQNKSCQSCHGNKSLFLQPADLEAKDSEANSSVAVPPEKMPPQLPPQVSGGQ